mmetsp:Transcript_11147/g.15508  ORF Transcript_11147/g.15508 Transcript_11147/m.15508 type:complete len:279 (+) Transcript_11147:95-931(+)
MGQGCCLPSNARPEHVWDLSRTYQEFSTPNELKMMETIRSQTSDLFDMKNNEHKTMLLRLWKAAIPGEEVPDLDKPHERWKYIGFQNARPETDFRAAGWLGLKHLVHFAEKYPKLLHRILAEQRYPWAAASINITEIIVTHLKLRDPQPKIAPIPIEKIYNLQSFMWIAFRAFKGRDPQAKAEFFAIDALHQCGAIMLDHLWNQRMERDRSTNLLHFKMALMETSAVMHHILNLRPDTIREMEGRFISRLPPSYTNLIKSGNSENGHVVDEEEKNVEP